MPGSIRFLLNGADVEVDVDPKASALAVLRDTLGVLTGKPGCSPQGLCGCCTALIGGKARLTCTLPVASLAGKSVTTMAGLDPAVRERVADAFVACGASQCGYCTPGIVLSTAAWLQGREGDAVSKPPTPEDIHRVLAPHTCRCTGYVAIAAGIRVAAGASVLPRSAGTDARALVLGERAFVADLVRDGMLHGAIVLAPVATGIVSAITAPDAVQWVALKAAGDQVLHAGDVVAAVAAPDWVTARVAAKAMIVEVVPAQVESGAVARGRRCEGTMGELLASVDVAIAASDPVFLEPECALAVPADGELLVYSAGHDARGMAEAIAARVGVPVRVVLVPSGGSYGGKDLHTVEVAAALLARDTGRPVRVSVGLEEGMRLHPRRPAVGASAAIALDARGGLAGVHVRVHFEGGQAPTGVARLVDGALGALAWECANVDVEATVHRSGDPSAGAIRGAGSLALTIAVESALARAGVTARPRDEAGCLVFAAAGGKDASLARSVGGTPAHVHLRVVSADEIEVQCNVPELGVGRDAALVGVLSRVTGLPADVFTIAWGSSDVVGVAGEGAVEQAAERAARCLSAAGGALARRVGRRFSGHGDPPSDGWSAARVLLTDGILSAVDVVVAVGEQDADDARRVAEGAAHMAIGIALSEEVVAVDGLPEGRFRFLGLIREKLTPQIRVRTVQVGGTARDTAEATVSAVASAIVRALAPETISLPMKDTVAARAVGVRPPRAPPV